MDSQIVKVKIHPAIGVARVGNSVEAPFIGPESPDQEPADPGSYKDASGALRRQAARFRVYGYNAAGEVVRELKPGAEGVSEIQWTVHLANKKAAWYQFHLALDIPEGKTLAAEQYALRNADVVGAERKKLVNDPGSRTVRGSKTETQKFDTGKIMGKAVYLGEISTRSDGRLVVLGGRGSSASYKNQAITGVANNNTWYDDVSDGPVTAKVRIDGKDLTAAPAWVVVGPPHYAPGVKSVRTLHDLLFTDPPPADLVHRPHRTDPAPLLRSAVGQPRLRGTVRLERPPLLPLAGHAEKTRRSLRPKPGTAPPDVRRPARLRPGREVPAAVAVDLRRRHGQQAQVRAPAPGALPDPGLDAAALGGRGVPGRTPAAAAPHGRRRPRRRATGTAGPGGPGELRRRRVPPGVRGHLADQAREHVQ
jgi:hypothetical protein